MPVRHRDAEREQLDGVEVEDAARLGLVAGGDVVAGEAADVLDAVQRGAGDLGLERERLRSRQVSCMTGSMPSCLSAIATASGDACACADVLSVAFIAST